MKLKEFSITRYGPLPNAGKILLHNFNLFWGKNEDGKTLTIDALVKLLLGRNIKDFGRSVDRVEEKPEGYVIIEDDKGKEFKLPEQGDLTKVAGLTSSQCRNIFVIRNSDLSIAAESEFYTDVTHRLTGLRTDEISKVKETLDEIGKMTGSGVFRDIKDEKLKTRVEKAKQLIEKIEILARKIEAEGFDELEQESVRLQEEIQKIAQDLRNLEDARTRAEYEKGKEALDKLTGALREMKGLEIYKEGDRQLWRDCENEIRTQGEQRGCSLAELREWEGQLRETSKKLREAGGEFTILDDRKKKLDDEVKPQLKNYEMELGKLKSDEAKSKSYAVATIISAVLLSILILAVALSPSPMFYGLLVFFLTSTVAFAILRLSFTQRKAHLAAIFERMRLTVSRFEIGAGSPEELHSNLQKFEEEHRRKSEEFQTLRTNEEKLKEQIRRLRDRELPALEEKIRDAEKKIQDIRARSKVESWTEYAEKLESRNRLATSIQEVRSVLRSHFGEKGKELEENVLHWSKEVQKLEEYKDKATGMKYDETAASELGVRRREHEGNLRETNEKMGSLRKEMEAVEREGNEILKLEEPLYCETSVDLIVTKDMLQSFIERNENNRDNSLKAKEIFEEIEREEKERVSELFGSESTISKYFCEITNGLYEQVLFDQETGKIQVKRRDGKILAAEKLSGGAYDQLYLSIRLALGEKLLKGKKGFFIMDDPLVKADPDRLQRQIQTLRKISELGWQVMYFSAKGEIKDALKEDITAGTINYIEVQGIFS
jgi:DNA repair exonuclease SbcCD ATPase subunit